MLAINNSLAVRLSAVSGGYIKMERNRKTGRLYFAGTKVAGTLSFGGNPVSHAMYVSASNSQGQFIWKRENTASNRGFNARPVIDDSGSIILTGDIRKNDTFNSYVAINTIINLPTTSPFVVKIDSNGNNKWAINASVNGASYSYGIAQRNPNEVMIAGAYPGKVLWQGATTIPSHAPNQGYDVFVTSFNSHTGQVLKVDTSSSSFGYDEMPSAMVGDGRAIHTLGAIL